MNRLGVTYNDSWISSIAAEPPLEMCYMEVVFASHTFYSFFSNHQKKYHMDQCVVVRQLIQPQVICMCLWHWFIMTDVVESYSLFKTCFVVEWNNISKCWLQNGNDFISGLTSWCVAHLELVSRSSMKTKSSSEIHYTILHNISKSR